MGYLKFIMITVSIIALLIANASAQVHGSNNPVKDIHNLCQAKEEVVDYINFYKRTREGLIPIQMSPDEILEAKKGNMSSSLDSKLQKAMQDTGIPYHINYGCKKSDKSNV